MTGEMAEAKGRAAVQAKGVWWYANHGVHSVGVEGPYVRGNQFVVRFTKDEVGVYTLQDGKIVEECFFYGTESLRREHRRVNTAATLVHGRTNASGRWEGLRPPAARS